VDIRIVVYNQNFKHWGLGATMAGLTPRESQKDIGATKILYQPSFYLGVSYCGNAMSS
jgi:hypothetical protein